MRSLVSFSLSLLLLGACGGSQPPQRERLPGIEVVVRNQRAEPIFLAAQSDCAFDPLRILGPDRRDVELHSGMSMSCEMVGSGETCPDVGAGACAGPELRRIDPGQSWSYAWDARELLYREHEQPGENCPSRCFDRVPVERGVYRFLAGAYASCGEGSGEGSGEGCGCQENDRCTRPESMPPSPTLRAEASAPVGQATRVELVFSASGS